MKRETLLRATGTLALGSLPLVAGAATFKDIVNNSVLHIADLVIVLLYAFAFLVFIFGVLRFFLIQGEESREQGKQLMFWGLISLVVLFAVWGIVRLFLGLLQSWSV